MGITFFILFCALIFVALEFFLPGGIAAVMAILLFLISIGSFWIASASAIYTLIFSFIGIIGIILVCNLCVYLINASGRKNTYFLKAESETPHPEYGELINNEGVMDSGYTATFREQEGISVIAEGPIRPIKKGDRIRCTRVEGSRVYVKKIENKEKK